MNTVNSSFSYFYEAAANLRKWAASWIWYRSCGQVKQENNCRALIPYEPSRAFSLIFGALEAIQRSGVALSENTPSLSEAAGRIFPQLFMRVKRGPIVKALFKATRNEEEANLLKKFREFDVVPPLPLEQGPLTSAQKNKIRRLICKAIQKREIAALQGCQEKVSLHTRQKERLEELLDKEEASLFSKEDWHTLDKIDFELIKGHLRCCTHLFNTTLLDAIQTIFKIEYGIDYKEALIAEVLAKSFAYTLDLEGCTIAIPSRSDGGCYSPASYRIKQIFLGDSLPCYVLEPEDEDLDPWLVVRGTVFLTARSADGKDMRVGSLESILADSIDSLGIAEDVIIKSLVCRPKLELGGKTVETKSLKEVLEDWHSRGRRFKMAAHSLGGYFITDIAIRFPDRISVAYAFNAPGMRHEIADKWEELILQDKMRSEAIVHFDIEGDLIPSGGNRLVGVHIGLGLEEEFASRDPIHLHLRNALNQVFIAQQIDIGKENYRSARKIVEFIRASTGLGIKAAVTLFRPGSLPDWWTNSKVYRRIYAEQACQD